jgi:hypothetical protein
MLGRTVVVNLRPRNPADVADDRSANAEAVRDARD